MTSSIQDVARLAGVSSRTLRHYDQIGLLPPSGTGHGGLRYYDDGAIRRLQRILLLRDLGLPLDQIAQVLDEQTDEADALRRHLNVLRRERGRLERQLASVERTLTALTEGRPIMAEEMLDGFDHTQYKDEVTERWGADAYATSDAWWRGLGAEGQAAWKARLDDLSGAWAAAAERGVDPTSDDGQALAARHVAWLGSVPGTPGSDVGRPPKEYVVGLAEMYVADERFAANYGGTQGASFVRDALVAYAEREL
ncbi:DNA-binding transcriptional MerR regulator [Isoptericola sp. CG 20/1183]|uniref:DNA-binding transcriptional MerR regulator n=1 Tax=Isoptericola halotolerans TaxID=300560 RepID=A0ABX5EJY0_9MICO|nr:MULTISPECIES: TipAS antibiotic-recognition domain-containing protein [Isoptericola]PRZ04154.1 DNA-binding transcriptional MerR regulator [Isoptericola sp. CG 20/1183]PRZ10021.1 DNA-binding transcriptional MerR regulator [Isoptericola halotolerans]